MSLAQCASRPVARGKVVLRRQLRRGQMEKFFAKLPPIVVGMEARGGAPEGLRRDIEIPLKEPI
jgi:transposase